MIVEDLEASWFVLVGIRNARNLRGVINQFFAEATFPFDCAQSTPGRRVPLSARHREHLQNSRRSTMR